LRSRLPARPRRPAHHQQHPTVALLVQPAEGLQASARVGEEVISRMVSGFGMTDHRMAMELPAVSQPWPPVAFNPVSWSMRTWQAWWSGDPDALMRLPCLLLVGRELASGTQLLRNNR